MARVESVSLVDDLDGSGADETVSFGLDGKSFEIDLSEKHAAELRDALAPFVGAARKAGGSTRSSYQRVSSNGSRSSAESRERNAAIRSWASENGFEVSERGRMSSTVIAAYENRGSAPVAVEAAVAEKPKRSRKKVSA